MGKRVLLYACTQTNQGLCISTRVCEIVRFWIGLYAQVDVDAAPMEVRGKKLYCHALEENLNRYIYILYKIHVL